MGARANICLHYQDTDEVIYLYAHWAGTGIAKTLQAALARKQRWGDPSYLARIIANELFAPALGENTGYGLSPFLCDNEYPILHVILDQHRIEVREEDGALIREYTFEQFIALPDPTVSMSED